MNPIPIDIGGETYDVLWAFPGGRRAVVRYEGLLVYALFNPGARVWRIADAASPPATEEEEAVLRRLIEESGTLDTTVTDVEPPSAF